MKPSREEFRALAEKGNLIPVFTELIADCETPVSAFHKLDSGGYSFLLESAETSEQVGRYSFVGTDPKMIFESRGRRVRITGADGSVRETEGDPLAELQKLMGRFQPAPGPDPLPFTGGAVGYLAYDAVRFFEPTIAAPPRTSSISPRRFS